MDIERFLKKLKIKLPYDQASLTIGHIPWEKHSPHGFSLNLQKAEPEQRLLSSCFMKECNAREPAWRRRDGKQGRCENHWTNTKNVTKLATTWLKWNWVPSYRAVFIEVHRLLLKTIHTREEGSRWSVPPRLPLAHCPQAAFGPVFSSWTLNPSWLPAASVTSASKGKTRVERWAEHRAHLRCDVMGLCLQEVRSR